MHNEVIIETYIYKVQFSNNSLFPIENVPQFKYRDYLEFPKCTFAKVFKKIVPVYCYWFVSMVVFVTIKTNSFNYYKNDHTHKQYQYNTNFSTQ